MPSTPSTCSISSKTRARISISRRRGEQPVRAYPGQCRGAGRRGLELGGAPQRLYRRLSLVRLRGRALRLVLHLRQPRLVHPGAGPDPWPDGKPRDDHTGGSVFKFNTKHVADGPTYVFHNSFHLREPIAKKKRFAKLQFLNNAIAFCKAKEGGCNARQSLFAQGARALAVPHDPAADLAAMYAAEKTRFTKDWPALEIVFDGNFIHGPDRLCHLRAVGYLFGDASSDLDPGFAGPFDAKNTSAASFQLDRGAEAAGKSISFVLKTKKGFQTFEDAGGGQCRGLSGRRGVVPACRRVRMDHREDAAGRDLLTRPASRRFRALLAGP